MSKVNHTTENILNYFEIAAELESLSFELDGMQDLLNIVMSEIFDKGIPENKPFVELSRYEMSFGRLVETVREKLHYKKLELAELSGKFYAKHKETISQSY